MFSFIVFRLHFKNDILKGKLTEITPGINYYLSTSLSKCFMQIILTSTQNFARSVFFSHTNSKTTATTDIYIQMYIYAFAFRQLLN